MMTLKKFGKEIELSKYLVVGSKYSSYENSLEILNNIWIDILAKYTESNSINCEKYTRLNVNYGTESIAILVYPNGTIMYQGNTVVSWAESHLENIARKFKLKLKIKSQILNV